MKWGMICLCLCIPSVSFAQNVSDLQAVGNGDYKLKIGNKKYIAIRENEYYKILSAVKSLKDELKAANVQLKAYKANSDAYEALRKDYANLTGGYKKQTEELARLNARYSDTSNKLVKLNKEYSQTLKSFDALVEKYRNVAIRSTPRNPVDVGLGILSVNDSNQGVFMFGAGVDIFGLNYRGWLYGGEDTYGAMVGVSF